MFEPSSIFNSGMAEDFWKMFIGEKIGTGASRTVYEYGINGDLVLKVEHETFSFHNIKEYDTWNEVKDSRHAKWFAPCKFISPRGQFLIQSRTIPVTGNWKLPKSIPFIIDDVHSDNWGVLDGKIVCHDYGHQWDTKKYSMKLKKADWK